MVFLSVGPFQYHSGGVRPSSSSLQGTIQKDVQRRFAQTLHLVESEIVRVKHRMNQGSPRVKKTHTQTKTHMINKGWQVGARKKKMSDFVNLSICGGAFFGLFFGHQQF